MKSESIRKLFLCIAVLLPAVWTNGCQSRGSWADARKLEPAERKRLTRLARSGDGEAAFRVYQMYDIGLHRPKPAYEWLVMAANNGHRVAAYNLAFDYYYNRHDTKNAKLWWNIAAERGDKDAEEKLRTLALGNPEENPR